MLLSIYVNISLNPRTLSGIMATQWTKIRLKEMSRYKVFWRNFLGIRKCFGFPTLHSKIFSQIACSIVFINRRYTRLCHRHETIRAPLAGTANRSVYFRSLTVSFFISPCVFLKFCDTRWLYCFTRSAFLTSWRSDQKGLYSLFYNGEYCQLLYGSLKDIILREAHITERSPKTWQRHFGS